MESRGLIPSRITQAQAEQLVAADYGAYVIKDLKGNWIDLTTTAASSISRAEFRSRKTAMGRSEIELIENETVVQLYNLHDHEAIRKNGWCGLEPYFLNGDFTWGVFIKCAIENESGRIVGSLAQGIALEETISLCHLPASNSHHLISELTFREKECLFYTIRGKTAKVISTILGISPKTVEFHLTNLKQKFNCYSKSELISKAIGEGFLERIPFSALKRKI